jgi:hypothetical protein
VLIDINGEVRNRALYAWGKLYWGEGKYELAADKWKQVNPSFPLSSPVYGGIIRAIESGGLQKRIKSVNDSLQRESLNHQQILLERNLRFHIWKKRAD